MKDTRLAPENVGWSPLRTGYFNQKSSVRSRSVPQGWHAAWEGGKLDTAWNLDYFNQKSSVLSRRVPQG